MPMENKTEYYFRRTWQYVYSSQLYIPKAALVNVLARIYIQ